MISKENLIHIQRHVRMLEDLGMQNLTLEQADRFVSEEDRPTHHALVDVLGKETLLGTVIFQINFINYRLEAENTLEHT